MLANQKLARAVADGQGILSTHLGSGGADRGWPRVLDLRHVPCVRHLLRTCGFAPLMPSACAMGYQCVQLLPSECAMCHTRVDI